MGALQHRLVASLVLMLALAGANVAVAQQPIQVGVDGLSTPRAQALRRAIGQQLHRATVGPDSSAETAGVLTVVIRDHGRRAFIHYVATGHADDGILLELSAGPRAASNGLWVVDAAVAAIRTVNSWADSRAHPELMDPWIQGHRSTALNDPFPEGGRPVGRQVRVDEVYVGIDIIDPWARVQPAATR